MGSGEGEGENALEEAVNDLDRRVQLNDGLYRQSCRTPMILGRALNWSLGGCAGQRFVATALRKLILVLVSPLHFLETAALIGLRNRGIVS